MYTMDAAMKAEYAKIIAKTDMKQIQSFDPADVWAVTALRKASPLVLPVLDSSNVSPRKKAAQKRVLIRRAANQKPVAAATGRAKKKRVA